MRKEILLSLVSTLGLAFIGACGSDDSGSGDTSSSGTSSNTSGGTNSGSGGSGQTNTNSTATTAGGGTGGATCDNTENDGLTTEQAEVPAAAGIYSYGDGKTTMCLSTEGGNQVCLNGLGADSDDGAGNKYHYWGAGAGIQLYREDSAGNVVPWDAEAAGVAGVRFTIAGVSSSAPVRMGMTLVNTDEVEFQSQGFIDGTGTDENRGGDENDLTADGTTTVMFDDLVLPPWTDYDGNPDTDDASMYDFDPTSIHSLQFQVVTAPGETRPYDFCVSAITWLDADGNEVDLPWVPSGGGEGGTGGAGGEGGEGGQGN